MLLQLAIVAALVVPSACHGDHLGPDAGDCTLAVVEARVIGVEPRAALGLMAVTKVFAGPDRLRGIVFGFSTLKMGTHLGPNNLPYLSVDEPAILHLGRHEPSGRFAVDIVVRHSVFQPTRYAEHVGLAELIARRVAPLRPADRPAAWRELVTHPTPTVATQAVGRFAGTATADELFALVGQAGMPLAAQLLLDRCIRCRLRLDRDRWNDALSSVRHSGVPFIADLRLDAVLRVWLRLDRDRWEAWGMSDRRAKWMAGWVRGTHDAEAFGEAVRAIRNSCGPRRGCLHQAVAGELLAAAVLNRDMPVRARENAVWQLGASAVGFDPVFDALAEIVTSGESERLRVLAAQKLNDAAHPPWQRDDRGRVWFSDDQEATIRRLLAWERNREVAFGLASALAPRPPANR